MALLLFFNSLINVQFYRFRYTCTLGGSNDTKEFLVICKEFVFLYGNKIQTVVDIWQQKYWPGIISKRFLMEKRLNLDFEILNCLFLVKVSFKNFCRLSVDHVYIFTVLSNSVKSLNSCIWWHRHFCQVLNLFSSDYRTNKVLRFPHGFKVHVAWRF